MRNEISGRRALEAMVLGVLDSGQTLVLDGSLVEHLGDKVDATSLVSKSPFDYLREAYSPYRTALLDFWCGAAAYRSLLEEIGYTWRGVNYVGGMEVGAANTAETDPAIKFYDGQILPYPNETFDVVFSFLTFQCLRRIDLSFAEVKRVLKPGGRLIGSVGYMEQMQDYMTFNYTPYGFKLACDQAGLSLTRISPQYDVFTWIFRRLLILTSGSDDNSLSGALAPENEIGKAFNAYGERLGLQPREINLMRLQFCSHFAFEATRPA